MFEIIVKVWYFIAILPFIIFSEGSVMLANFLKKKKIYSSWDILHSLLLALIILLFIYWITGIGD